MLRHRLFQTFFIVSCFLFFSCSKNRKQDYSIELSLSGLEPEFIAEYQSYNVSLENPAVIRVYSDSLVLISERKSSVLLRMVDINSGNCVDSLARGRGPEEFLSAWDITVINKDIVVHDILRKRVSVFRPDSLSFFDVIGQFDVKENYLRIIPSPIGGYVALPNTRYRMVLLSDDGTPCDTIGTFPQMNGDERAINNTAAQSQIVFSSSGDYFCSTFLSMNCIEIYLQDSLRVRLLGPGKTKSTVMRSVVSGGVMYTIKPAIRVFSGSSASDSGFMVGFAGEKDNDIHDFKGVKELLLFDWSGKCLERYLLPFRVLSFDVDWPHRKVFAITAESEPRLVSLSF